MLQLLGLPSLSSGSVTLQSSLGQDRLTAMWPMLVDLPSEVEARDSNQPMDEDPIYGKWVPVRRRRIRHAPGVWSFTGIFSRQVVQDTLLATLTDEDYLQSELARLTKFNAVLDDTSPVGWVVDLDQTNDLGRWNLTLASLPGNWGGDIFEADIARGDVITEVSSGAWVASEIASELLEVRTLQDCIKVLAGYQLAVNSATGRLSFMNDTRGVVRSFIPSTWNDEDEVEDHSRNTISCQYVQPGQDLGIVSNTQGGTGPDLVVREPANSRQEALLEIDLQRVRLRAERYRASMAVPLNYTLSPLDLLKVPEVDRTWQVLAVTHRYPSGSSAPELTEAKLRGLSAA